MLPADDDCHLHILSGRYHNPQPPLLASLALDVDLLEQLDDIFRDFVRIHFALEESLLLPPSSLGVLLPNRCVADRLLIRQMM